MYNLFPSESRSPMSIFEDFLDNSEMRRNFLEHNKTDIYEEGDKYIVEMDVPGFSKEDISIEMKPNKVLVVSGQKKALNTEKDQKHRNYICRERTSVSFSKSFALSDVEVSKIQAKCESGVLHIELPKIEPAANTKISIS